MSMKSRRRVLQEERARARWKQKKAEACCCTTCGKPLGENDLRVQCRQCWHKHSVLNAYRYWFTRLFN